LVLYRRIDRNASFLIFHGRRGCSPHSPGVEKKTPGLIGLINPILHGGGVNSDFPRTVPTPQIRKNVFNL
jgi:hypothetical protein